MNKVTLIGNLTKDPDMRQTQSGTSNCVFSLAVRRKFKNSDGEYETDFVNCVAWKGTADICGKYLKKGSRCAVSGSIQTRTYEKDGVKRTVTEIVVEDIDFLDSGDKKPSTHQETAQNENKGQKKDWKPVEDDALPF